VEGKLTMLEQPGKAQVAQLVEQGTENPLPQPAELPPAISLALEVQKLRLELLADDPHSPIAFGLERDWLDDGTALAAAGAPCS
jgi:hypothetical protein